MPSPIDEVIRIPISESQIVRSMAVTFQTTPKKKTAGGMMPAERAQTASLNPLVDAYKLAADVKIIQVIATVRYRVSEPLNYALNFVNASNVLQNAVDSALFYVSSRFNVEQATRLDQIGFREAVEQRVRELARQYELGVSITECQVKITPP